MRWNRITSALIAVLYIIASLIETGAEGACIAALFCILPLACIWFADDLGGYVGRAGPGVIMTSTPGVVVCIVGWFLLSIPFLIWITHALRKSDA